MAQRFALLCVVTLVKADSGIGVPMTEQCQGATLLQSEKRGGQKHREMQEPASPPTEVVQVEITADTLEHVAPPHRHVRWECVGCLLLNECPSKDSQDRWPANARSRLDRFYPSSLVGKDQDSESDFYIFRPGLSESAVQHDRTVFEAQDHSMASMMIPKKAVKFICHRLKVKVRYIRKELRQLTDDEWHRYAEAFNKFKYGYLSDNPFPNLDSLVSFHAAATLNPRNLTSFPGDHNEGDQAHAGPAFALWHAATMLGFERSLQAYDPSVAAHYWDFTDSPLGVFNSKFYGEADESSANGCRVLNGPFQNWTISFAKDVDKWTEWMWQKPNVHDPNARLRGPNGQTLEDLNISYLGRRPGGGFFDPPAGISEVHEALSQSNYYHFICRLYYADASSCSGMESHLHAFAHAWYTGRLNPENEDVPIMMSFNDGGDLATSPNDPAWFGLHSMVERIHQAWFWNTGSQLATSEDPCGGYDNPHQRGGHNLHDVWEPKINLFGSPEGESSFTACSRLLGDNAPYVYNQHF